MARLILPMLAYRKRGLELSLATNLGIHKSFIKVT
jgi:hypothetical protein